MANYKILVVDDEEDLCEILKFNLEVEGYDVDASRTLFADSARRHDGRNERIQNGLSVKKKREAETYSHHFFNGQRYRRRQTHGI